MNLRRISGPIGGLLGITLPLWIAVPIVSYVAEIILVFLIMVATIEGRAWIPLAGAGAGLILGGLPGVMPLPMGFLLPLWLKAVMPALILGLLMRSGWHAGRSFVAASLMTAALIGVVYFQAATLLNNEIDLMTRSLDGVVTTALSSQGYGAETISELIDKVQITAELIKRLLPGILVMSGLTQLFVGFLLLERYCTRADRYFPGFGPFIYWKIPDRVLYLLGIVLTARLTLEGTRVAADNLLFVLAFCYAVGGLALIEHLLRRLQLPIMIKIVFYLGLFLMQVPGLILTSAAGLFDSYFDFRRVRAHTLG